MAKTLLIAILAIGVGFYAVQTGQVELPENFATSGQETVEDVTVYWHADGEPPACATGSDGIDIKAIARDQQRRLGDQGTLQFQWKSDEGWKDFKRDPAQCSQQDREGGLFCTVSTSYGLNNETVIGDTNYVRAQLTLGNQTATSPVRTTEYVREGSCG